MIGDYLRNGQKKRVKPDSHVFDMVIKAYTVSDTVTANQAFRAESLMRRMWTLHEETGHSDRPQATTYKYVIVGFKKAGAPQRAEELLWEMERKAKEKPSQQLFQTVLNAWHDSRHPERQQRINALRLAMNERFGRPAASGTGKNGAKKRPY